MQEAQGAHIGLPGLANKDAGGPGDTLTLKCICCLSKIQNDLGILYFTCRPTTGASLHAPSHPYPAVFHKNGQKWSPGIRGHPGDTGRSTLSACPSSLVQSPPIPSPGEGVAPCHLGKVAASSAGEKGVSREECLSFSQLIAVLA